MEVFNFNFKLNYKMKKGIYYFFYVEHFLDTTKKRLDSSTFIILNSNLKMVTNAAENGSVFINTKHYITLKELLVPDKDRVFISELDSIDRYNSLLKEVKILGETYKANLKLEFFKKWEKEIKLILGE
jgi:hypothetical protein